MYLGFNFLLYLASKLVVMSQHHTCTPVNTETFSFQQVNVKTASMCQTMRCGSNQNSLIETEVMKTER